MEEEPSEEYEKPTDKKRPKSQKPKKKVYKDKYGDIIQ